MTEKTNKIKQAGTWLKDHAIDLGVGALTVAVGVTALVLDQKQKQKALDEYSDYLDDRREIMREGLDYYKAGLPPVSFDDQD